MKKAIAFLLCLFMIVALISCNNNGNNTDLSTNDTENTTLVTPGDHTTETEEKDIVEQPSKVESPENKIAMQAFQAAINGEICVVDERLGEISWKSLRFPSNDTSLDACKLLKKAILDVDQDGVNEYVIQSPNQEYIILRHDNGKVYSYCLNGCDYYRFNTDGTFYWCNSPNTAGMECGLNKITFAGETLNVKFLYSLKYSNHPDEYVVGGKAVTSDEYYDYRQHHLSKESLKFSQFEPNCSYPITAEQAWNLANEYWDHQDGRSEGSAGTIWTARIVLTDTPNSETNYYRVAFQVDWNSGGALEGYECVPPYSTREHDQILVNAFTGEIKTPAYEAGGTCISVEKAIEIAQKYCGESYYAKYDAKETAPDHIYVIVFYNDVNHNSFHTRVWVDKYTGEIVFGYYLNGK